MNQFHQKIHIVASAQEDELEPAPVLKTLK